MGEFRDVLELARVQWKNINACVNFLKEKDHAYNVPGGSSLGYDVKIKFFEDVECLNWCADNCKGYFFRRRDDDDVAEYLGRHNLTQLDQSRNIIDKPPIPLSIITFSNADDAVRFKLISDSLNPFIK